MLLWAATENERIDDRVTPALGFFISFFLSTVSFSLGDICLDLIASAQHTLCAERVRAKMIFFAQHFDMQKFFKEVVFVSKEI